MNSKTLLLIMQIWVFVAVVTSSTAVASNLKGPYLLGNKDVIEATVFAGGDEQIRTELEVSEGGIINFPYIGHIKASGLSCKELENSIVVPLAKDYYVNPQVNVKVKEYHSLNFVISGAVNHPGKYVMREITTLLDIIARAGGATKDRGNKAYVLRKNNNKEESIKQYNATMSIDLGKLLDEGELSGNIVLQPGDTIYIPISSNLDQNSYKIYVSGEVKNPAMYEYKPGLSVLKVCIMAGGFSKYAAPNRTTVIRNENGKQQKFRVNLNHVIEGKAVDFDVIPGDRINVPESWL